MTQWLSHLNCQKYPTLLFTRIHIFIDTHLTTTVIVTYSGDNMYDADCLTFKTLRGMQRVLKPELMQCV